MNAKWSSALHIHVAGSQLCRRLNAFVYSRICRLKFGSLVNILYGEEQSETLWFSGISSDVSCMNYEVGARRRLVMLVFICK